MVKTLEKISDTDDLMYILRKETKERLEKEIKELQTTLQFSNDLKAFEQQQLSIKALPAIDDTKYQTTFENFVKEEREFLTQVTPEQYEAERKATQQIISNEVTEKGCVGLR